MAELILQEEKIIFSVKVLAQWALYEKKKKKKKEDTYSTFYKDKSFGQIKVLNVKRKTINL